MRKPLVFITCLFLLLIPASAANMQKVYTARDAVYQRVERLCRIAGVSGPSAFSPLSARGLEMALERIDKADLDAADRAEYDRLLAEIKGNGGRLVDTDGFSMDLDVGINVGVNIADYADFDWSNSSGIAPDRRFDALLQYRFEEPSISIHPGFYFGDHVYMDGDFALQNNNHHMYESTFGWLLTGYDGSLSVFGSNGPTSPPGELPLRAGLSAGSDHVSFIIGRYPHSIGSGITGNLVVGDNFIYQEVAALSFMSRYFTYNISVTRFDQMESKGPGSLITDTSRNEFTGPQQYRVIHRFDVPIIDRGRVSLNLGTIYNSDFGFDLRFFYPFVLGHNYYNYDNSTTKRPFDEANNIISLSTEWMLGGGFSIYGEIAIDQAQMPWENKASVPSAYGVLLNLRHSTRIGSGAFAVCGSLRSVALPSTLERIESGAFSNSGDSNYFSVTIPASVTYIGTRAFWQSWVSEAVFEQPEGWAAEDLWGESTLISTVDLSDAQTAARLLHTDLAEQIWQRG